MRPRRPFTIVVTLATVLTALSGCEKAEPPIASADEVLAAQPSPPSAPAKRSGKVRGGPPRQTLGTIPATSPTFARD